MAIKKIVAVIVAMVSLLVVCLGCGQQEPPQISVTFDVLSPERAAISQNNNGEWIMADWEQQHKNNDWIAPALVHVTEMRGAGTARQVIRVHAGENIVTRKIQVITEPYESVVVFNLNEPMSALSDVILVNSSLETDKLIASEYNAAANTLTIRGFTPESARVMDLEYRGMKSYILTVRAPDNYYDGGYAAPPINIASSSTVVNVKPRTSVDVEVALYVSTGLKFLNKKWEFWVSVMPNTGAQVVTEQCQRWLITMR